MIGKAICTVKDVETISDWKNTGKFSNNSLHIHIFLFSSTSKQTSIIMCTDNFYFQNVKKSNKKKICNYNGRLIS
jgi:hypothetical protein